MILEEAKQKVFMRLRDENLLKRNIRLRAKVLSPREAIGNPEREDFPLLKGKERIIEAEFEGFRGHAFTDMYGGFEGTVQDVFEMPLANNYRRALVAASINALSGYWGLAQDTVHCKDNQPGQCAQKCLAFIASRYPKISRVALVGYQPAFAETFSKKYALKILDLDKNNIGQKKFGTKILDGAQFLSDAVEWAQVTLATGSMLVNGSIDTLLEKEKDQHLYFYGVTIAGVAALMGLNRLCFVSEL